MRRVSLVVVLVVVVDLIVVVVGGEKGEEEGLKMQVRRLGGGGGIGRGGVGNGVGGGGIGKKLVSSAFCQLVSCISLWLGQSNCVENGSIRSLCYNTQYGSIHEIAKNTHAHEVSLSKWDSAMMDVGMDASGMNVHMDVDVVVVRVDARVQLFQPPVRGRTTMYFGPCSHPNCYPSLHYRLLLRHDSRDKTVRDWDYRREG